MARKDKCKPVCCWLIWPIQNATKKLENHRNPGTWLYSSESTQWELSNRYQHDRVKMFFKSICVLLLWTKVASALEGLTVCTYVFGVKTCISPGNIWTLEVSKILGISYMCINHTKHRINNYKTYEIFDKQLWHKDGASYLSNHL